LAGAHLSAGINAVTILGMEHEYKRAAEPAPSQPKRPDVTQTLLELLSFVLSDAESDISVAARDLGLLDANYVRLRRAQDRVECAQRLLETMRQVVSKPMRRAAQADSEDEKSLGAIASAMELLAREWPEEYPAEAVEWLIVEGKAGIA
jgi:hypothetical protein